VPNDNFKAFFGSPAYNSTWVDAYTGMIVVEHDFGNGLTAKNSTMLADFNRGYQNVFPGSSVAANNTFLYNAYNHITDRESAFNQTDFIYKTLTGSVRHTIAFGTEFDTRDGDDRLCHQ
jgi:catecholate siderophore receptor